MKKKISYLVILIVLMGLQAKSQDYQFSQFYNTPLLLNPALTGLFDGNARTCVYYRNQWAAVLSNPYETFGIEAEMKVAEETEKRGPLNAGLSLLRDRAGASKFTFTNAMLSLGYQQKLNLKNYLGAGIQFGMGQYNINYADLFWGNQYDAATNTFDAGLSSMEPNVQNKFNHFNVSAGVVHSFRTSNYKRANNDGFRINTGISIFQRIIPKSSFYNNTSSDILLKYCLHTDGFIGLSQYKLAILPRVMYASYSNISQLVLGATLSYKATKESAAFNLGCYYRMNDAVVPYVGLEFSKFQLGISYDSNISELNKYVPQTNALEINLIYIFNDKVSKSLF